MGEVAGEGKLGQKCLILEDYSKCKIQGSKRVGVKVSKPEDYSNWEEEESKRVGAKVCKTGRLLQEEGRGKQAGWSRSWQNRNLAPSGKKRKASGLEQKLAKPESCSKRKE